jgi:hypothetical protein
MGKRISCGCAGRNRACVNRHAVAAAAVILGGWVSAASATTQVAPVWLSATAGSWTTGTNWSTNPLYPDNNNGAGYTYAPIINATGSAYTVSLGSSVAVDALTISSTAATLSVFGGTLNVGQGIYVASGTLTLDGNYSGSGTINGGTLSAGSGGVVNLDGSYVSLNGVSLGSNISFTSDTGIGDPTINNGLNLNGHNLNLSAAVSLISPDGSGINGNGVITITAVPSSAGYGSSIYGANNMTIGAGVTIQTGPIPNGSSSGLTLGSQYSSIQLQGTILDKTPGITTSLAGNWTNTGTINVSTGATLQLGGSFTTSALGTINNTGGTINFTGNWDNSNTTFTLTPSLGNITFPVTGGGTLTGGTFNATGGTQLIVNSANFATLSNITIAAPISVGAEDRLAISGNVNLSGNTITLNGNNGGAYTSTLAIGGQNLGGTGTILFNKGNTTTSDSITNNNNTSLTTIGPGITLQAGTGSGYIYAGVGYMNFSGNVITGVSAQSISFSSNVNFSGSVNVLASGSFTAPSVINFNNGTISSANYIINGNATLRLPGANIVTDNASITFNGSGSNLYSDPTASTNALAGLTTIGQLGSLNVTGGRSLPLTLALDNQGTINISSGSMLGVYAGLTIDHGGLLTGAGTLAGSVSNSATVAPGSASSVLHITGNYTQSAAGNIDFLLSSKTIYDALKVDGSTNLAGNAVVSDASGFTPALGETFTLLQLASPATGSFSTLELPPLTGLAWNTSNLYTNGTISVVAVVPEPATLSVVLLMVVYPAALLLGRRRKTIHNHAK